jgi:hypothetical protein
MLYLHVVHVTMLYVLRRKVSDGAKMVQSGLNGQHGSHETSHGMYRSDQEDGLYVLYEDR